MSRINRYPPKNDNSVEIMMITLTVLFFLGSCQVINYIEAKQRQTIKVGQCYHSEGE